MAFLPTYARRVYSLCWSRENETIGSQENLSAAASELNAGTKAIALVILSVATFMISFMAQGLTVALPVIGREFEANTVLLSWMVLAFVLANAALSLPIGRISDIIGIRKIFIYGMILYTLSSLAAIFSTSSIMLIICRLTQGISGSMILVNVMALITSIFPAKERGLALGINTASVYIGASTGPFLGGLLTQHFGWRSIFLINIPAGLLVILVMLWKMKGEWAECKGQPVDYVGSIIYGLSLITSMYGFSLLPGITGMILILIGIVGLLIFLRLESRIESPVLDVAIFRNNKTFIFSNLAALINYSAVFAVSFLLSLYLQYIKGLGPEQAGLVMIANPIMQAILSPLAGRLSDKIEPRLVASIGMALTTMALVSFIFLDVDTSLVRVIIALILLGTGFALFLAPNTNAIMGSITPKYYGVASAAMSTMISGGQTLSMGITMVVMAVIIGKVAITPEYYPAFLTSAKIAFGLFSLICFGGIFVSLSRGKVR